MEIKIGALKETLYHEPSNCECLEWIFVLSRTLGDAMKLIDFIFYLIIWLGCETFTLQVVMRRAQSVAAWARPTLRLSSWSCMAPRQRTSAARSNSNDEGSSPESSSGHTQTSEPLLTSPKTRTSSTVIEALDLPVSTSVRMEWTSEIECSISDGGMHQDTNGDEGEDLMDHDRHKDRMTEVELWQQLEHELYDRTEGEEADVANEIREEEEAAARREEEEAAEIREEEEAAIAEVSDGQPESSSPEMKEAHRFFPAGKIMHIVTLHSGDANCEGGSPSSSGSDEQQQQPEETRIGIFLTPRSLYSKLRLSQTMISDHFMPVYRRRIEKLIKEFEKEAASIGEVVL